MEWKWEWKEGEKWLKKCKKKKEREWKRENGMIERGGEESDQRGNEVIEEKEESWEERSNREKIQIAIKNEK